ncbi:CapA family protein [Clostridium rectalis]|uniref:CapA family protein n=1 Tax=Clostridium rectalis TaxID=2040295 RepID=UPI0013DE4FAE|nr:CapA family protein [Clostridium rectalis]
MGNKTNKKPFIFIFIGLLIMLGTVYYVIYYSVNNMKKADNHKNVSATKEVTAKVSKEKAKKDTYSQVLISFSGDSTIGHDSNFNFANSLPDVLGKNNNDLSYFYKNVLPIFKKDDITITNLETTFTNSKEKAKKDFNFKADPSYAEALSLGSIEGVNLSNNHIYDYKKKGFEDTIKALKHNNINFFGQGNIWVKQIKGIKFGFLGYLAFNDTSEFRAKIKEDIKKLKNDGCMAIINFHWGIESNYYPIEMQTNLAHFAIDNGADLIIGHHPHVIQGIEKYKNKFICYSLGNFCFGGNFNPKDKDTFIFQIKYKFKDNKAISYGVKAIPCSISSVDYINDYCPTPLKGDNKARVLKKINKLSPNCNFKISDEFYNIDVKN